MKHIAHPANRAQKQRAVALLKRHGMMRGSELSKAGIHSETLVRMLKENILVRINRGLYQLADAPMSATHDLAAVSKLVPGGIICLVTALQFHELTNQMPRQIWLAIGSKARSPRIEWPPLRIVRFGRRSFDVGVQTHQIEGVQVPISDPAKTVVDCFRFRNLVGLDVALEGLHNVIRYRKADPAKIVPYALETRIWSVLQPYLVTVVADGA